MRCASAVPIWKVLCLVRWWPSGDLAGRARHGARDTTDRTEMAWTVLAPLIPAATPAGRPRTTAVREVVHAIFEDLPCAAPRRVVVLVAGRCAHRHAPRRAGRPGPPGTAASPAGAAPRPRARAAGGTPPPPRAGRVHGGHCMS